MISVDDEILAWNIQNKLILALCDNRVTKCQKCVKIKVKGNINKKL